MEQLDNVPQFTTANSPEFEFSMLRNPSFPQPHLLSADQLFSDGFLLPLHLLRLSPPTPPHLPQPQPSTSSSTFNTSKGWRYIFKKNYKKNSDSTTATIAADTDHGTCVKDKDAGAVVKEMKKREKSNGGVVGVGAAELNINIWPFSRSRSAGNGGARPRSTSATRRVSSAPCSRSNSTGHDSKTSRKWSNSPNRGGLHLGRSSPVWPVRRAGGGRSADAVVRKTPAAAGSKARVLSLNVPMCIGYRNNLSCRNDENGEVTVAAEGGGAAQTGRGVSVEGVRRSNLFNIRTLFAKKDH